MAEGGLESGGWRGRGRERERERERQRKEDEWRWEKERERRVQGRARERKRRGEGVIERRVGGGRERVNEKALNRITFLLSMACVNTLPHPLL